MNSERNSTYASRKTRPKISEIFKQSLVSDSDKELYSPMNFINVPDKKKDESYTLLSSNDMTSIYLVQNRLNKKYYIKKSINYKTESQKEYVTKIITAFRKYKHPNILKLYSSHQRAEKVNLYLHFCEKGTLKNVVNANLNQGFSEEKCFTYFYQIISIVKYFHDQGVVLRNLNIDNILVGKNNEIFLYDFSQSQQLNKKSKFYDTSDDIFNIGVILFILTQGIAKKETYAIETKVTKECKDLMSQILEENSITKIEEIFEHDWVRKYCNNPNLIIMHKFRELTREKVKKIETSRNSRNASRTITQLLEDDLNKTEYDINYITSNRSSMNSRNSTRISSNYQSNSRYEETMTTYGNIVSNTRPTIRPGKKDFWKLFTNCFVQEEAEYD